MKPNPPKKKTAFEQAGDEAPASIVAEFVYFLRENKKWWLAPILIVIALVGVLVCLSGSGVAPFIYTLF